MTTSPCDDCGLCCTKLFIEIQHIDVVREPKLLTVSVPMDTSVPHVDVWETQYLLAAGGTNSGCKLLDSDRRCTIYPTRPNCCVGFEVGGNHCNELREEHGLPPVELKES